MEWRDEGLIIGIKPIKKETREERMEKILKDLCAHLGSGPSLENLRQKAKALLEEKE